MNPLINFLSGRDLVGDNRTDATFWSDGQSGESGWFFKDPTAWGLAAGWKRVLGRAAGLGTVYGAWAYRTPTEWILGLLASVLGGYWCARGVWAVQDWHINRRYVQPLHHALVAALQLPPGVKAGDYIDVPPDFAELDGEPVTVQLPHHFDAAAENQARIGGLIIQKLHQSERTMTCTFSTVGRPFVTVRWEPKPPDIVVLTPEIVAAIDAAGPAEMLIGVDAGDHRVWADLATESPHWAFSCESGAGKSSFLEWLAAQILRKNPRNQVWYIDPKFASLPGLVGVPNVRSARNPIQEGIEEMWALLQEGAAEVMRRGKALQDDPTIEFPKLLFIIDEVNLLASFSATHWNVHLGNKGKPPMWGDVLTLLAAGRQFGVHMVIVGQDLRDSALGGIGLRAMLGLRGIGGQFDVQMWVRFMQVRPVERPSTIKGRWNYSLPGVRKWIQNVYATHEQINALARKGDLGFVHPDDLDPAAPASLIPASRAHEEGQGTRDIGTNTDTIVGLQAGADYLGISFEAFKARRTRAEGIDGEFRRGNQPAWTPAVLDAFNSVGASK